MENKDYLVQVRVKNNPFFKAMKRKGVVTATDLSRLTGVSNTIIGDYLNLRRSAFGPNGILRPSIVAIAKLLNVMPCDLFPPQHYECPLDKNTAEVEMSIEEVGTMISGGVDPQLLLEKTELKEVLQAAIDELPARDKKVIEQRWFEGKDSEEVAKTAGEDGSPITACRVRQIEVRAIRRLRESASLKRYLRKK